MRIRKIKKSDLKEHLKLVKTNKNEEIKWIEKAIKNYNEKIPNFYSLAITINNKYAGNIVAEKLHSKKINIGYWIDKKYQNKGYVTKALLLFLKKIKRKFKLKKVYASNKKQIKPQQKF